MGMVMKKLEHGAGSGPAQRQIVAVPPLAPEPLHQRGKRESVDGAFRHRQPGTNWVSGQQRKIIPLVAALYVDLEAVPRPPQTGKPGAARGIPAHKYTVLIFPAFIERTSLDTRLQQLRVDASALQIGQHGGGEPAGLRERKGLRRFWLGPFLGRRGAGAAQGLHRLRKVQAPDFDQKVQRRPPSDPPAVPAPQPTRDFQAVMGPGAVFVGTAPLQFMRIKGLKVGKKVPLLRLFDLLLGHT